ncbi:dual specificity protein phosphatase 14 [Nilaparvata lugens]|uniref:dual specificity protein phosphatase 14 n=1 Tax=Nilaparvata lugens TaxID=108931 RepID=UPI00193DE5C8|nr:dual specificity protein phosphatase 14 [Nilaparvata lugens]
MTVIKEVDSSSEKENCMVGENQKKTSVSDLFSISEVAPELLLCGAAAVNEDSLKAAGGVACVISAAPELPPPPLPPSPASTVLRIPVLDTLNQDILTHLHRVADQINEVKCQGGRTLVHCVAGVSRSATLCLAYLIKYHNMSLRRAFNHLRSRRRCVRPNSHFFYQLIQFELEVRGKTSVEMRHNMAARAIIPDVYEEDYIKTLHYQNRNIGRH